MMALLFVLFFQGESPQWMVPVSVATSANPNEAVTKVVLDKPSMTITLDDVKPDQWVKVRISYKWS